MIAVRATRHRHRTLAWALTGVILAAVGIFHGAPYANVTPGPAPDIIPTIIKLNDPANIDPTFGRQGEWVATTINATPLTWAGWLTCKVRDTCHVYPLVSGNGSKARSAASMDEAVTDAAAAAAVWTGGSVDYPVVMKADLGEIGGPSAGLMMTLAFIDAATAGDLTAGRIIAGTGTINSLNEVGPVSGVEFKVRGAQAAGAHVFLTPGLLEDDTRKALAGTDVAVVPADTLADALRWLCDTGGKSSVCDSPALTPPTSS